MRVTSTVQACSDKTWVAITDPILAGTIILGDNLANKSEISAQGDQNKGHGRYGYEERGFDSNQRDFEYLPRGQVTFDYTIVVNNADPFQIPVAHVQALYVPEMFTTIANATMTVALSPL